MFELGPLRLDLISDGLFELRPETFVKISRGRSASLLERQGVEPRIRVGFNSLLVRGHGHTVLIDPGTGDKPMDDKVVSYKMEWPRKLFPTLEKLGVRPADVDTVVLTHLHWDHAGGATTVGYSGAIEPAFPQATYYLHQTELDAAREGVLMHDDGYSSDDFEPLLNASVLELIHEDDHEVFPWLSVHLTGGHSPGHMVVKLGDAGRKQAIYFSDLVPTTSQLPLDSAMSYDVKYDQLAAAKKRFIDEAAAHEYLCMFVHSPRNRAGYLQKTDDNKIKFRAVEM
jgi:glyoxylase-like metal-dependent hydrolase (beta-lactamase superfamily II)